MIRVLIVGRDYGVRKTLGLLLATAADIEVVAQAAEVEAGPALAAILKPDVVVIDAGPCQPEITLLTQTIDSTLPELSVLVLHDWEPDACPPAPAGNITYLCKCEAPQVLVPEILRVARRPRLLAPAPGEEP